MNAWWIAVQDQRLLIAGRPAAANYLDANWQLTVAHAISPPAMRERLASAGEHQEELIASRPVAMN